MGMSNSSICVLAVVTSFALLTLTHEEADYYMGSERIVASRQSELSITLAGWIQSCLRAVIGATFAARRAGMNDAMAATAVSVTVASAIVVASAGVTP